MPEAEPIPRLIHTVAYWIILDAENEVPKHVAEKLNTRSSKNWP